MLTICWDLDDVLNNLMESWLQNYNYLNKTHFQYKEIIKNPPYEILGISENFYKNILDIYRKEYYDLLSPNKIILEWFKQNGHRAYFSVLTATPTSCASISLEWLMRNFGNWIRQYAFIPSTREQIKDNIYDKTKADWLVRNKADLFIDDSIKNCKEANEKGIATFCVKQPWNNGNDIQWILNQVEKYIVSYEQKESIKNLIEY